MKKVIIKCFYKIKFSIFACNFLVNIIYLRLIWWLCKSAKDVYLYKNNIRL